MDNERQQQLLSRYIDGELDEAERRTAEELLTRDPAAARQVERWRRLGTEIASLGEVKLHDDRLDRFETHVYARLERGVAWILLSVAATLLLAGGVFYFVRDFLGDAAVPLIFRVGTGAGALGGVLLAISVLRHRLATYRTDKYKGVIR